MDCVISNCIVNLVPDKSKVFREILRVLKPGSRIAISDIALKLTLPPDVETDITAYVGCISGAIPILEYETAESSGIPCCRGHSFGGRFERLRPG